MDINKLPLFQWIIEKYYMKMLSVTNSLVFSFSISWRSSVSYFILRVVFELVFAVAPVILAYIGRNIINLFSAALTMQNENISLWISRFIGLLAAIFVIQLIGSFIQRMDEIVSNAHKDLISHHMDMQIINKSSILDLSFYDSPRFQDELMVAKRDSQALQSMAMIPLTLIRSIIQLCVTFPLLFKLHWIFPLSIIILKVPAMIVEKKYTLFTYNWSRNRIPEERKKGYIQSILISKQFAKDLKLFDLFNELKSRYVSFWQKWFNEKRQIEYKRGIASFICNVLLQIGNILILLYLGLEIIRKNLTLGDYSFFNGISAQFTSSLNTIISSITQLYDSELKISNYIRFIECNTNLIQSGRLEPSAIADIEFRNVTYRYPDTNRDVLINLSFTIHPGENVALVGLNGAGKSTIVKLLMRFYDPTGGQILLGGIDIREYDLNKLRRLFTAVFQDYPIYAFTARENVTISDLYNTGDDKQVFEACEISGMDKMLNKWKNGLNTFLTKQFEEDGEELSGGERQKIAIARAFFRKSAGIVVLDEPSSALDPETEHSIFTSLSEICNGKTSIFISHHLSNITMADKILVLENGKIIEEGRHDELLAKNGRYTYLFSLQAQKYMQ